MPLRFSVPALAVWWLASAEFAQAQLPALEPLKGRLAGVVYDSLARRTVAGALVQVSGGSRFAITDSVGRFTLDSLPFGPATLAFSHPALDSIGLSELTTSVVVREAMETAVVLATPSYATIAARLCPGEPTASGDDRGVVVGNVTDVRGTLFEGARVEAAWIALDDPKATEFGTQVVKATRTDAGGRFVVCGVPRDQQITVVALTDVARTGLLDMFVPATGVIRLELQVARRVAEGSAEGAPLPLERSAQVGAATTTRVVRGLVSDSTGQPIAGARVRVDEGDRESRTDADGRFALAGVPEGSQMIEAAAIGYDPARQRIEVAANRSGELTLTLRRAIVLATINVRARATTRFLTELAHRQQRGWGLFVTEDRIRGLPQVASALQGLSRVVVQVNRGSASVFLRQGTAVCRPDIYVDGFRVEMGSGNAGSLSAMTGDGRRIDGGGNLDQVPWPDELVALEVYRSPSDVPIELKAGFTDCGAIFAWTKAYAQRFRSLPAR